MGSNTGSPVARADHEIVFVLYDRLHQFRDRFGPVATVAIEKDEDLRPVLDRRGNPFGTGPAVTALSFDKHRCSDGAGLCDSAIAAAAVDDDDLVDPAARHSREHRADGPFLVEHRNDYGDARASRLIPSTFLHRLQRTPHEAQAAGGPSLNNARRKSW